MTRAEAVQQYVDQHIQTMLAKGDKDIYDDSPRRSPLRRQPWRRVLL